MQSAQEIFFFKTPIKQLVENYILEGAVGVISI